MDLSHLVKYCRFWKSGSQTALSTTVLKRLCNRLRDPGVESHDIPPLPSFSGLWDHNQGSAGWDIGRFLMPLMWKTQDLLVGKFSQNFGAIFWNTLGELGKCLGVCSALIQWSWCRLPCIPMKALHSQYFPIPYVIISYKWTERHLQRATLPAPQFIQANKMDLLIFCFAKSTKELKIPIDI